MASDPIFTSLYCTYLLTFLCWLNSYNLYICFIRLLHCVCRAHLRQTLHVYSIYRPTLCNGGQKYSVLASTWGFLYGTAQRAVNAPSANHNVPILIRDQDLERKWCAHLIVEIVSHSKMDPWLWGTDLNSDPYWRVSIKHHKKCTFTLRKLRDTGFFLQSKHFRSRSVYTSDKCEPGSVTWQLRNYIHHNLSGHMTFIHSLQNKLGTLSVCSMRQIQGWMAFPEVTLSDFTYFHRFITLSLKSVGTLKPPLEN